MLLHLSVPDLLQEISVMRYHLKPCTGLESLQQERTLSVQWMEHTQLTSLYPFLQ